MPKSARRSRKPPSRRQAPPTARASRTSASGPNSRLDLAERPEDLADGEELDEDDSDVGHPAVPAVRESTLRRARVPELLEAVSTGVMAVRRAERDLDKRVRAARAHGASWEDIGIATGLSRQGAAKRWG